MLAQDMSRRSIAIGVGNSKVFSRKPRKVQGTGKVTRAHDAVNPTRRWPRRCKARLWKAEELYSIKEHGSRNIDQSMITTRCATCVCVCVVLTWNFMVRLVLASKMDELHHWIHVAELAKQGL